MMPSKTEQSMLVPVNTLFHTLSVEIPVYLGAQLLNSYIVFNQPVDFNSMKKSLSSFMDFGCVVPLSSFHVATSGHERYQLH